MKTIYGSFLCPAHANLNSSSAHIKSLLLFRLAGFFLICLSCLFSFSAFAQQTASLYVGQSTLFSAPNPPVANAALYNTAWGARHKAVSVEKYMTYGARVTVNEYFEGSAEIQCDYYYYAYIGNRQVANHSTTYFYVTCRAVECRLNTYSMTLSPGERQTLSYTLLPNISPTPRVRFYSSNNRVADVNDYGSVYAVGPGECTITVENSAGPDAKCSVRVRQIDPTRVFLSSPSPIYIGQTITLVPELYPDNAQTTYNWSSSNSSVATVNSNGVVTGKSEGTARITVRTANNLSASCDVSVFKPVPASISLNKTSIRLTVGTTETLTYSVSPSYAIYTVSWESDAGDVVAVSNGRIEAKVPGTANITVRTDNGKTATCRVIVPPEPTVVTLSPDELELIIGRKKRLSYAYTPSDAATRSLTWQSSDSKVASVDSNGEVTALRPGQATITATTANGVAGTSLITVPVPLFQLFLWTKDGIKTGYLSTDEPEFSVEGDMVHFRTKQLTLDVKQDEFEKFTLEQVLPEHPQAISMPEELKLGLGRSRLLSYSLSPADAETRVSWFNDNPKVVEVSNSGQVTGLQVGTARIMAQTSNGLRAECQVIVPEPQLCFYVWLRNGGVHSFDLEDKPQVTLGEEHFTLTSATTTVTYDAANVLRFTLQDAAVEDIPTDIIESEVPEPDAAYRAGELTLQGEKPHAPVRIYDVNGRQIESLKTDNEGRLSVSLSSYRAGIYIVKTKQITFKIQKK